MDERVYRFRSRQGLLKDNLSSHHQPILSTANWCYQLPSVDSSFHSQLYTSINYSFTNCDDWTPAVVYPKWHVDRVATITRPLTNWGTHDFSTCLIAKLSQYVNNGWWSLCNRRYHFPSTCQSLSDGWRLSIGSRLILFWPWLVGLETDEIQKDSDVVQW